MRDCHFGRYAIVFIFSLLFSSMVGCDCSSQSSRQSPKAEATKPESSGGESTDEEKSNYSERQQQQAAEDWKEARSLARDPSRDFAARIGELNRFIEKHPGAAARSYKEAARGMRSVLEARRQFAEAHLSTRHEIDEMVRHDKLREVVESGDVKGMFEAVLAEQAHASARWADPDDHIDPVDVRGPVGSEVTVESESSLGLNAFRNHALSLVENAAPALVEGVEAPVGGYDAENNAKFNAVLADRLGGDLFDEQNPGRLNRGPLRRLLDRVERHLDEPVLGVEPSKLVPIFGHRLREYALVHQLLVHEVGRDQVLQTYEEAKNEHSNLLSFYRKYTRKTFRQGESPLDHRYSLLSNHGVYVSVGFWMRRMADGTARDIYSTLEKVVRKADPDFHQRLRNIE